MGRRRIEQSRHKIWRSICLADAVDTVVTSNPNHGGIDITGNPQASDSDSATAKHSIRLIFTVKATFSR
jgi:hypothetical protein